MRIGVHFVNARDRDEAKRNRGYALYSGNEKAQKQACLLKGLFAFIYIGRKPEASWTSKMDKKMHDVCLHECGFLYALACILCIAATGEIGYNETKRGSYDGE